MFCVGCADGYQIYGKQASWAEVEFISKKHGGIRRVCLTDGKNFGTWLDMADGVVYFVTAITGMRNIVADGSVNTRALGSQVVKETVAVYYSPDRIKDYYDREAKKIIEECGVAEAELNEIQYLNETEPQNKERDSRQVKLTTLIDNLGKRSEKLRIAAERDKSGVIVSQDLEVRIDKFPCSEVPHQHQDVIDQIKSVWHGECPDACPEGIDD